MNFSVLVAPSRDYNNWPECFKALADLLEKEQKVKPGYWESVFAREQSFPTGLQITPDRGIAIPHPSDPTLVKESTVAVIILPNPIEVCSMAEPEEKIMVSVVLMLALRGSEDHLTMLQQMMETFQDETLLKEMLGMTEPEAVKYFLEEKLGKE
jgi:PTS system galactitol-specific IIA component